MLKIFILGFVLLLFSCSPSQKAISTPMESSEKSLSAENLISDNWQEAWEKDVVQAKKQGRLVIYTGIDPQTREPLSKTFKEKFGIDIEWLVGRGNDIAEKILRERRAGLYLQDLYIGGGNTVFTFLKPADAVIPLGTWLSLPEVTDVKNWYGREFPFGDRDQTVFTFLNYVGTDIGINTDMVKPGEITSHKDLLNPKWKDKIILNDPTIMGSSGKWAIFIGHYVPELGWDFHRSLTKQNPTIMRDERVMAESVARGKFPIVIGVERQVREFKSMGLPAEPIALKKDGTYMSSGYGNVAVMKNAPHPEATKIFLNWLLTREGQTIITTTQIKQSSRLDTPTDHLQQTREEVIKAGGRLLNSSTEEFNEVYIKNSPNVKEIYGPLLK